MHPVPTAAPRPALLRAIALCHALFAGPCPEDCQRILGAELPALAGAGHDLPPALAGALDGLARTVPGPDALPGFCRELAAEHVAVFVARRGGVPCPPYQSCWEGEERMVMGPSARAMAGRLAEAGLEQPPDANEPPDHLCIELEYLHVLLADDSPRVRAEAARFAGSIRAWTSRLAGALRGTEHALYARLADVLEAVLEAAA